MDPLRFLESEDPTEILVMVAIMRRWFERRKWLDEQLAVEVINTFNRSQKKG